MYVHACTYRYIFVRVCTHMYIDVHTCIYMCIHLHICAYMYIYVQICTYMYISVHTCTYMCIYVHVCISALSVTLSDMALPSRPLLVHTFASWTVKLWLLVQEFVRSLLYFHISPSVHIAISRRCLRGLRLLPLLFNDAYMDLGMRLPWFHFLPIFCCTVPYQKVFQQRAERA